MNTLMRIIGPGLLLMACAPMLGAQDNAASPVASPAAPAEALSHVVSGLPTSGDVAGWTPVSQETLDETRGGFDMGNGLVASFGIDRAVYVNGNLVTSTSFNIPDIAHMTQQQAMAMQTALNTVSVTQVGPNNSFDPSSLTSGGTVIQNTLNNQKIQSITTINTSVNSLNAFREQGLQETLQQAQLQSLSH